MSKINNNVTIQALLAENMVEYGGTANIEKVIADGTLAARIEAVAASNELPVSEVLKSIKRQIASFECNAKKRGFGDVRTANKDKAVAMVKSFVESYGATNKALPSRSIIQQRFGKAAHALTEDEIREAMTDEVMAKKLYDSFADYSSKHGYEVSDDFFARHELVKELYRKNNAAKRAAAAAQSRVTEVTTEQTVDVLRKKLAEGKPLSKADKELLSALLDVSLGK